MGEYAWVWVFQWCKEQKACIRLSLAAESSRTNKDLTFPFLLLFSVVVSSSALRCFQFYKSSQPRERANFNHDTLSPTRKIVYCRIRWFPFPFSCPSLAQTHERIATLGSTGWFEATLFHQDPRAGLSLGWHAMNETEGLDWPTSIYSHLLKRCENKKDGGSVRRTNLFTEHGSRCFWQVAAATDSIQTVLVSCLTSKFISCCGIDEDWPHVSRPCMMHACDASRTSLRCSSGIGDPPHPSAQATALPPLSAKTDELVF